MPVTLRVTGVPEAQAALGKLREGAEVAGRTSIRVGATMPYAGYVEYGTRHMRARPYLRPALEQVERSIRGRLVAALPGGARPVASALLGVGRDALAAARRLVPVRTGDLRRSLYLREGR